VTPAAVPQPVPTVQPGTAPSAWVQRFAGLICSGGTVLDVACGSGRHLRWLAGKGWSLTGVDRDATVLAELQLAVPQAELIVADLEGAAWPLGKRRFDAVVVTNYLWRPLWPALLGALADEGVLLIETFAHGQGHIGRPARADFLLQPGELLRVATGLRVVAFEDGFEDTRAPVEGDPARAARAARYVQRVAAVREDLKAQRAPDAPPPRYALDGR
jgi:SAM-dependent methyltransferase